MYARTYTCMYVCMYCYVINLPTVAVSVVGVCEAFPSAVANVGPDGVHRVVHGTLVIEVALEVIVHALPTPGQLLGGLLCGVTPEAVKMYSVATIQSPHFHTALPSGKKEKEEEGRRRRRRSS